MPLPNILRHLALNTEPLSVLTSHFLQQKFYFSDFQFLATRLKKELAMSSHNNFPLWGGKKSKVFTGKGVIKNVLVEDSTEVTHLPVTQHHTWVLAPLLITAHSSWESSER